MSVKIERLHALEDTDPASVVKFPSKKPKGNAVRFSSRCEIMLIPSRMEYLFSGLDLWYTKKDEAAAEKEALAELKQAMMRNSSLTFKAAQTLLYQPTTPVDSFAYEPIHQKASRFGDVVKVIIVNSSSRLYRKYSEAIFQVLEQSAYRQSEFYHLHSIEDFFQHRMYACKEGTVGGSATSKGQGQEGIIPHIIIFDQDEFCAYDVQITTQIVACLRKHYDQASTLIGFYADGESSSTMYMKLLDFDAIDFRYLQPNQDPMAVLSSMVNKPMNRLQTALQSTLSL